MSDQREMTLDEYLESKLPDSHLARRQLQELRDALAALEELVEQSSHPDISGRVNIVRAVAALAKARGES